MIKQTRGLLNRKPYKILNRAKISSKHKKPYDSFNYVNQIAILKMLFGLVLEQEFCEL